MTKYFSYKEDKVPEVEQPKYNLGDRALKEGMTGADVKLLQEALIAVGYSDVKADGVLGKTTAAAVLDFKKVYGLKTSNGTYNATYGSRAHEQLMKILSDNEEVQPEPPLPKKTVRVYAAGSWNVRKGPGTNYEIVTIVKHNASFPYISTADNGWIQVEVNGKNGWLSPKCAEVTTD